MARSRCGDLTADHVEDPIGERTRPLELVTRHHDGCACVDGLTEHGIELVATGSIETCVRLVEQPQLGSPRHETRERRPSLLTGRQLRDPNVGKSARDAQPFDRGPDLVMRRPDGLAPEGDVLGHGEVGVQPVAMTQEPHPGPDGVALRGQIVPQHGPGAAGERQQASAQPQQAGLAGAVWPLEQHHFADVDAHRRTGQYRETPEHGHRIGERDRPAVAAHARSDDIGVHGHGHATWHFGESGSDRPGPARDGIVVPVTDERSAGRLETADDWADDDLTHDEHGNRADDDRADDDRADEHGNDDRADDDRADDDRADEHGNDDRADDDRADEHGNDDDRADDDRADDDRADDDRADEHGCDDDPDGAMPTPWLTAAYRRWREQRSQQISKWDRPPDPHDWRFFVGNLGKVLIATGLLLFGFVAYQLWGTSIETGRAQSRLESEFERLIADSDPEAGGGVSGRPGDAGSAGTTVADVEVDVGSEPETPADGTVAGTVADGTVAESAPPAAETDLSERAVDQVIPPLERGAPLALLEIPAIGRSDIVVPGVALDDLKSGPGHYPDTPLPGQLGNASIAGHRTTYGAPFFDVDQLKPGDELIVTMVTGDRFVYEVTGTEIVAATDYWVVATRNPRIAELTLTSCHPKYTARDRIVVHSVLNADKSSEVGVPTFYDLDGDGDRPIPGDDPVVDIADESTTTPSDDPVADTAPQIASDTESDTTPAEPAGTTPDAGSGSDADVVAGDVAAGDVEDAFSQGWFDDPGAWPQIALWGTLLTIISLLAYAVSRHFRRDIIGLLVGIGPFLFVLYFFFQNVNRLLPPGL